MFRLIISDNLFELNRQCGSLLSFCNIRTLVIDLTSHLVDKPFVLPVKSANSTHKSYFLYWSCLLYIIIIFIPQLFSAHSFTIPPHDLKELYIVKSIRLIIHINKYFTLLFKNPCLKTLLIIG